MPDSFGEENFPLKIVVPFGFQFKFKVHLLHFTCKLGNMAIDLKHNNREQI